MKQNEILHLIETNKPSFADTVIQDYSASIRSDAESFSMSKYWCGNATINVHDVVGTMHPDYIGMSWFELLQNGKRMHINLKLLEENPIYYSENKLKEPKMFYERINDKLYISTDGNHRTCIAKFYDYYNNMLNLHGVDLTEYTIDYAIKEAYLTLDKLIKENGLRITLKTTKKLIGRDDTSGWMREHYKIQLFLYSFNTRSEHVLTVNDVNELLSSSKQFLKSMVGKYKWFWK